VLSEPLRLPLSLGMSVEVMSRLGAVLIIILAGTIVGGEYGVGTIRLLFTRGPTRTEFFLSKIGTLMLCTALGLLATVLLGLILGLLLNFFTGVSLSFTFLSGAWFGHALLYVLSTVLGLVIYAIMALSFSVLGRATPAGIAAGLIWWGVEPILSSILSLAGNFTRGPTGSFLAAIPDYFIGTNISALAENQRQYLFGGQGSSLSDLHALLVLAVYLALFIGLAAWVNVRRDVTN
jgi:ABC-type transport system involved in multi-copper enzyme maturation permease subunit